MRARTDQRYVTLLKRITNGYEKGNCYIDIGDHNKLVNYHKRKRVQQSIAISMTRTNLNNFSFTSPQNVFVFLSIL
jgi:hypothetical protein